MYLTKPVVQLANPSLLTSKKSSASLSLPKGRSPSYSLILLIVTITLSGFHNKAFCADKVIKEIASKASAGLSFSAGNATMDSFKSNENQLSIIAVGDILLHQPLHTQALQSSIGHKSLWKYLLPVLEKADIAYGNLEGPVAPGVNKKGEFVPDPGNVFDQDVYSSYPRFNYHESLIQDLIDSGVDVVSTANNHALDHGSHGVDRTTEMLNKHGLSYTGTKHADDPRSDLEIWPTIVERNNFRTAWIACTFSTNGLSDKHHQVLHCFENKNLILSLIKQLSSDHQIDAVFVTPHVGNEYEDLPHASQVALYHAFADAGALAIFGAHPHVLQPWEKYLNKKSEETFIIYSLGNFVSGQFQKVKTRASIMLNLTLIKNENGKTQIAQVQYLPLEMQRTRKDGYTVVPISDRTGNPEMYNHIKNMFGTPNMAQPNSFSAPSGLPSKLN